MTSTFRRRLAWCVGLVLAAAAVGAAVAPVLLGHTEPPVEARATALRALDEARRSGAATYDPAGLAAVERALDGALTGYRRQELRFVSLRDFRPVRAALAVAEETACDVAEATRTARFSARDEVRLALEEATDLVGHATRADRVLALAPGTRRLHARAGMRLAEARAAFEREDYVAARDATAEAQAAARVVLERGAAGTSRYVDPDQVRRWRGWIDDTIRQSRRRDSAGVVVYKERNLLELYVAGRLVRSYAADIGKGAAAQKYRRGDGATPEGHYRVVAKKAPGQTKYHRALLLDYPNAEDLRRFEAARKAGRIPTDAQPGGLIEIHGEGGRGSDWTLGCPALSNDDMDHLWRFVEVGTPVTIVGGDGNGGRFSDLHRTASRVAD